MYLDISLYEEQRPRVKLTAHTCSQGARVCWWVCWCVCYMDKVSKAGCAGVLVCAACC